ncbi:MAG TPA: TIGR04283 family arsenosugar biosynthesis glycosyltransferase [Thermoanaerobaculia bacterium]|nr:TIGR04283 family arsenosugar biosynthesis glycosyltransferase [Thermoanaerobaculia bacterium]
MPRPITISVIVPVKGERPDAVHGFLLLARDPHVEILVADGGGCPETSDAFRAIGAKVISDGGSRGARLDRAAREATGDAFLFVHSDSRIPEGAVDLIRETLRKGAVAGAFSLGYQDAGPGLRWIAAWANLRSRWLQMPFGDQGIFCSREAYQRAGGFRDLPICDDVDFVRRLKRVAALRILPQKTLTSPRRYRDAGKLRQVLRNWRVLAGYFAGVPSAKLQRWYNGDQARSTKE